MMRFRVAITWLSGLTAIHSGAWAIYWLARWSHPSLAILDLGSAVLCGSTAYAFHGGTNRLRERLASEYLAGERERLLIERSSVEELADIYGRRDD